MTAGGPSTRYIWSDGLETTILGRTLHLHAEFGACPVILLGREDFFAAFEVAFNQREKTFSLDPY